MDKKKRTKILGGIVAVLLLGIAVFFGGFRVTSVKVEGNTAHTDKEIKKMVLLEQIQVSEHCSQVHFQKSLHFRLHRVPEWFEILFHKPPDFSRS